MGCLKNDMAEIPMGFGIDQRKWHGQLGFHSLEPTVRYWQCERVLLFKGGAWWKMRFWQDMRSWKLFMEAMYLFNLTAALSHIKTKRTGTSWEVIRNNNPHWLHSMIDGGLSLKETLAYSVQGRQLQLSWPVSDPPITQRVTSRVLLPGWGPVKMLICEMKQPGRRFVKLL